MKKTTIFLIITLFSFNLFSQRHILKEDIDEYNYFGKQEFGVNGAHFVWLYYDLRFFTPSVYENQLDVKYGQSYAFTYGSKYKLRIFNWLAMGTDFNYNFENYAIKNMLFQTENQTNIEKISDKFFLNNLGSEFYIRLFIGKHGNAMGKFIDFGAFGTYTFANSQTTKITYQKAVNYSNKTKITNKKLSFIKPSQYGGVVRLGVSHFAIVGKYRFSDILKNDFQQTISAYELPKLSIGIELSIF